MILRKNIDSTSIEAWGYDYIDFLHANRPTAS